MGRRRLFERLWVRMNGFDVGRLTHRQGRLSFAYEPSWIEREGASPLSVSLPLSLDPFTGPRVAAYFDNLLPDHMPIRERMQRTFEAKTSGTFDLLAAAGGDCVGAIQLLTESSAPFSRSVEATPVSDGDIAGILRDLGTRPLGLRPDEDDFRISLAGVQDKTALLLHQGKWMRPEGATPTSHIFKPSIGQRGAVGGLNLKESVANEWLCLRILKAFGLPTVVAARWSHRGQKALVVTRFDRRWSKDGTWLTRLPQEDLCQALGVPAALKYESDGGPGVVDVMDVLLGSVRSQEDRETFMRAQVLFWMLGATDGHAKNFSLFLLPGGRYRLTPLYDVLSVYPLIGPNFPLKKAKMAMGVHGKNKHYRHSEIRREHWLKTAKASHFSPAKMAFLIEESCRRAEPAIRVVQKSLPRGFPKTVSEPIFRGLRKSAARYGGSL